MFLKPQNRSRLLPKHYYRHQGNGCTLCRCSPSQHRSEKYKTAVKVAVSEEKIQERSQISGWYFIGDRYDWTTGCRTMEISGGSSMSSYLDRAPCVPSFCTVLFTRGGNRRAFRPSGEGDFKAQLMEAPGEFCRGVELIRKTSTF